jgi:hypothetical protein
MIILYCGCVLIVGIIIGIIIISIPDKETSFPGIITTTSAGNLGGKEDNENNG